MVGMKKTKVGHVKKRQASGKTLTHFKIDQQLTPDPRMFKVLSQYFGYCLYRAAIQFKSSLDHALSAHGFSSTELGVLRVLHLMGNLSQNEIGNALSIDKASMVKFIDALEEQNLIQRETHPTDRRAKLIRLTKTGERALEKVSQVRNAIENEFLSPLSPQDVEHIRRIIPLLVRKS